MPIRAGGESEGEARERERQRRGPPEPPRSPTPQATLSPQASPTPSPAPAAPGPAFGLRAPQVEEPKSPYQDDNIISVRALGTSDERIRVFLPREFEVGDQTEAFFARDEAKLPDWAQGTTTETFKVLSKEPSQAEGSDGWVYDMIHADIFQPVVPNEQFYADMSVWSERWNGLISQSEVTQNELRPFVPEKAMPMVGRPEDVMDAEITLKFIHENATALVQHMQETSPESIEALFEAEKGADNESRARSTTLDVDAALSQAINTIAEEHPDDYTTLLSTPEGMIQLWEETSKLVFSAPPPTYNLFEDPRDFVLAIEQAFVPDIPIFKDILLKATETLTDPAFLFATAVLPPAGLAQKSGMLIGTALGMAAGEEAAELVGAPPIIGALPGAILGGGAGLTLTAGTRGFTRASMTSSLQDAKVKPIPGEPATEILLRQGEILDARALRVALGESRVPPGINIREVPVSPAEVRQGRHIAQAVDASGAEVGRLQWREIPAQGAEPGAVHVSDVVVQVEGKGVGTGLMADLIDESTVRGVSRITGDLNSEGGIRLFGRFKAMFRDLKGKVLTQDEAITTLAERRGVTGEIIIPEGPAYPAMAGGAQGPTLQTLEDGVRIMFERPESRDVLRWAAEQMAHLPGGKRMIEIVNRAAIAGDDWLKSAFGWQFIKSTDDAARQVTMGGFRGRRYGKMGIFSTPFRENNQAQIWVPGRGGVSAVQKGKFLNIPEGYGLTLREGKEASFSVGTVGGIEVRLSGEKGAIEVVMRRIRGEPSLNDINQIRRLLGDIGTHNPGKTLVATPWNEAVERVLKRLGGVEITSGPRSGMVEIPVGGRGIPRPQAGGEWVSGGDVIESVMRGEKTYLSRLTETQLGWIDDIKKAVDPYVRIAERETGMQIARRQVHWPRFVVDSNAKSIRVGPSTRGKPPALFQRVFESQQQAIEEYGIRYKPGLLNQAESLIEGMQRVTRDAILTKSLKKQKLIRHGRRKYHNEEYVDRLNPATGKGFINKDQFRDIQNIIGPSEAGTLTNTVQKGNAIARLVLTGSMDMGQGAIQLMTLAASPAGPKAWAEVMGRSFWNAIVEPKQVHRFLSTSPKAARASRYGLNLNLETEFLEATRTGIPLGPIRNIPGAESAVSLATYPLRSFLNRLGIGFESALLYGRVMSFDAMADVASGAGGLGGRVERGLLRAAGGPAALKGKAFHDEMFRVARFTDTLIGQPKLTGAITAGQLQAESAFVWFATRYTRSVFGTMAYMAGRGFTPAQARVTMAKFALGGMATTAGLIAAKGEALGLSKEEVLDEILTAFNPQSGKKFMSIKLGKDWYGIGGAYRSMLAGIAGLANKKNWETLTWEESLWDNPITRIWRTRTTPITSTFMDFMDGEDFMGYEIDRNDIVTDMDNVLGYALDKFAPITSDAILQDAPWSRRTPRFIAEFFGLRTSPETAWEAMEPVLNRVSQQHFGSDWAGLEHNMAAQDLVRNHPDVMAVAEGRVMPFGLSPRQRRGEAEWERYYSGRGAIRDRFAELKNTLDERVAAGRLDGREYREQYGEAQSNEFFELTGFREGLGFEFDDEEEAPVGTVDAALKSYYEIDLDDYRDRATGVPDWEAFFSDRDAAIAQVPEESDSLVEQYLGRHKSPLRQDFSEKFDSIIKPSGYLRMREAVAESLGLNVDNIEQLIVDDLRKRDQRAAPIDVAKQVDAILDGLLVVRFGEDNAPTLTQMKNNLRETSPQLDLELYRQGFVTTVRSLEAQSLGRGLMNGNNAYFIPPLSGDVRRRIERTGQ